MLKTSSTAQESAPKSGPLRKRADLGDWFYTPSWRRSPPPRTQAGSQIWLVIEPTNQPLVERLIQRLEADRGQVIRVAHGERFVQRGNGDYALNSGRKADWEALVAALKQRGVVPTRILHATSIDARARWLRTHQRKSGCSRGLSAYTASPQS